MVFGLGSAGCCKEMMVIIMDDNNALVCRRFGVTGLVGHLIEDGGKVTESETRTSGSRVFGRADWVSTGCNGGSAVSRKKKKKRRFWDWSRDQSAKRWVEYKRMTADE